MDGQNQTSLVDQVRDLVRRVEELLDDQIRKPEINPKARYRLSEAADFLGVSESTIRRRANVGRIVIKYDGRTPFITGAELLRYAREGTKRQRRRRTSRPPIKGRGGA